MTSEVVELWIEDPWCLLENPARDDQTIRGSVRALGMTYPCDEATGEIRSEVTTDHLSCSLHLEPSTSAGAKN